MSPSTILRRTRTGNLPHLQVYVEIVAWSVASGHLQATNKPIVMTNNTEMMVMTRYTVVMTISVVLDTARKEKSNKQKHHYI